jgi:hypothetical protein
MVRKNPAAWSASSSRGGRDLGGFDENDYDGKASKIKRRKDSQTRAIFFCLSIIAFLGIIAKVKVNHWHKFTRNKLRTRSPHAVARQTEGIVNVPGVATNFLPPHSIYKLEVKDIFGKMINFSKFQGMVTLVVNVACL